LWQIVHTFDASVNYFVPPHVALAYGSRFREFLERPQREPLSIRDITKSTFNKTLITQDPYQHLVAEHFQQYPVLYVDLKVNCRVDTHEECADRSKLVQGATYEEMLISFDEMIREEFFKRTALFRDGIVDEAYIEMYRHITHEPHNWRRIALRILSEALQIAYKQSVVVLIDEYDAPMHSAMENGYADLVRVFVPSSSWRNSQSFLFRPARSLEQSSAHC
jgi:hypothetical protein